MDAGRNDDWWEENMRYLSAALDVIRRALEGTVPKVDMEGAEAPGEGAEAASEAPAGEDLAAAAAAMPAPPAVERLAVTLGLSEFERSVLLLCAGVELAASFGPLCAAAHGDARRTYPTFSLALIAFPGAHWSALSPARPLRRHRLIEVQWSGPLALSPLRIDEGVLHYLTGVQTLDDRLRGFVEPIATPERLPPSHQAIADQMVACWSEAGSPAAIPAILDRGSAGPAIVALCGAERSGKRGIAAAACAALGLRACALRAADIPQQVEARESLLTLWHREAALLGAALLIDAEDPPGEDRLHAARAFLADVRGVVMIAAEDTLRLRGRRAVRFDVESLAAGRQHAPWREELDAVAQRIEPAATWEDLVLPAAQIEILRDIAAQVRHRSTVYGEWGFARRCSRGLGISALFTGPSGTGKTMAAEVLANELGLDLYRIDLSQVVSKYIGETEKNLRRAFDAADQGGAILLFDEADALFGKRSEVKDSHDRYANIEVSYLLQRMEAYRGLAILTTNLRDALDQAFLRRIRFAVRFPFPDRPQRAEIWRRVFPPATPVEGLDYDKLAQLNAAGGSIRNIALQGAFLAAEAGEPVRMAHITRAARAEYAKLEKPLTQAEMGGWV